MTLVSSVPWCDDTVSPVMGCAGCELWNDRGARGCYAGLLHETFGGRNRGFAPTFEQPIVFAGRMHWLARQTDLTGAGRPDKPWLNGAPRTILVSEMGEALSEGVSFEYLEQEILVPVTTSGGLRHRWMWLTRRPRRMRMFSTWAQSRGWKWPPNLWVGTSVMKTGSSRVPELMRVGDRETMHFVVLEPQVHTIDVRPWADRVAWIVQGGMIGRVARPFDIAWARDVRDVCGGARTPYFLSRLGRWVRDRATRLLITDTEASDWRLWPRDLAVREIWGGDRRSSRPR